MLTNNNPFQKNICFKYRTSMIKAKLLFSELQIQNVIVPIYSCHSCHGNKGTILFFGIVNVSMSAMSANLYFVEII